MHWAQVWWSRSSATTLTCRAGACVRRTWTADLGPIPTNQIGGDQPHEGNLFDHLYGRRAIQRVA